MKTNRHKLTKREKKEELAGYLFLAPNLIGTVFFIGIPVIASLLLAFTKWDVIQGWKAIDIVGLDNFKKLFEDPRFFAALKNNIIYTAVTVPLTITLAVMLAAVLNRAVYAKPVIRAMFFMPYISSMVAVSIVWNILLYPEGGPVNAILSNVFHITNTPGWFTNKDWALPGLMILAIWYTMGYYMIILLAGMQNIPLSLYEAAELDGAGWWKRFTHITVPMVSPTMFFVFIIATINSFKVFDQIKIITDGGPGYSTTVLVYEIYRNAFYNYDFGYASSISWILLIIVLLLTVLQWGLQKKWVHY